MAKGKNLQKVQDMVDGKFTGHKTMVGQYNPVEERRKIGDRWIDSDGKEWEQKDGYRSSVKKTPSVGIFPYVCKDCKGNCSSKKVDLDTWKRMERCYNCQVTFELDLRYKPENRIGESNNKHYFWVKLQQLKRWEAMEAENEKKVEQLQSERESNNFNQDVANALANANIEMNVNKNKNLTGG